MLRCTSGLDRDGMRGECAYNSRAAAAADVQQLVLVRPLTRLPPLVSHAHRMWRW